MKIGLQAYIKGSTDAIDFYQKAFGTVLGYNVLNADGTYMHAELYLGDQMLIALSEAGSNTGTELMMQHSSSDYPTMNFGVNLGSAEAVTKAYEVLTEGGIILLPIGPLPWNACCANVIDRFGVFWYISI